MIVVMNESGSAAVIPHSRCGMRHMCGCVFSRAGYTWSWDTF